MRVIVLNNNASVAGEAIATRTSCFFMAPAAWSGIFDLFPIYYFNLIPKEKI